MQIGDLVTHRMTNQLGIITDIRDNLNIIHPYKVRWITTPPVGEPTSSPWGWYHAGGVEWLCR